MGLTCFLLSTAASAQQQGAPPSGFEYFQYGVALTGEIVAAPGDVCPKGADTPCILGSGGGLTLRGGYRGAERWYVGGAYSVSRHDSANLFRLAILQQLRAETRYYFDDGRRLTPYFSAGLGGLFYGNEWGTDTGGIVTSLGGGVEFQISRKTVIGGALAYRPMLIRGWTDGAGERRADRYLGFGLAHIAGLEVTVEIREPLARW